MAKNKLKPSETAILSTMNGNDLTVLSKLAGNSGTVLDVKTMAWGYANLPFSFHYNIYMDVRARLIDAATGKIIAQSNCGYGSGTDSGPTYDEMFADHAAVIKSVMASGVAHCSDLLRQPLFGN